MAGQLQKIVAEKKNVVETVMEVFEQGAEVVASIAGDLFPVFAIAAPIVKLALDNVESKEAAFMKEQFQKFREVKKKLFMEHFVKTGGDKNLHTLYSAVTGDNFSGESVLEITLNYEEKSRRAMEDFCARTAMTKRSFFKTGGQKKLTVVGTAELLFEQLPGPCAVHTVKTCKDLACVWSFAEELHYWEEHKNFYVCVHYN
ncbi:unnamed protein product [Oncorhynchus mykiss]|uniref:Rapunzel 4 n=1 Tax=Oncorhynchus mykiss TaxID=8022 RepID=A0A060XW45_ONCMY|nr:unnamed protein product [Oncorhynchus mykiss]